VILSLGAIIKTSSTYLKYAEIVKKPEIVKNLTLSLSNPP